MWEPKMCRHAWQRPQPSSVCFATSQACLQRSRRPRHALQRSRSPTSKKNPPTCCLISCEAKRVVYHQASMLDSQDIAKHAKDVASMPRTLQSMPRTLPSMPRSCKASLHILGSHINNSLVLLNCKRKKAWLFTISQFSLAL